VQVILDLAIDLFREVAFDELNTFHLCRVQWKLEWKRLFDGKE